MPRSQIAAALAIVALAGLLAFRTCGRSAVRNLEPSGGPVVVLGDSLAAGVGAPGGGYVHILSRRLGVELVNRGVPGNTTADGLARLDTDVLPLKPALVVVQLGGNDFLRQVDPDETFGNLATIIERCQAQGAAVLLVGVRSGLLTDRNESRFRDLAQRTQAAYVPNLLEGVFGQPALMHDSIHPNASGYERVADRIEPTLRELLTRLGKVGSGG